MMNRPDSVNFDVLSLGYCADEWYSDDMLTSVVAWLFVRHFTDCEFVAASDTQALPNLIHQVHAADDG